MPPSIADKLLNWYTSRRRSLPWRDNPQPYAVWVAEIMAQQTQLDTMLPYFERWMQRFPTVEALATSDEQEVLKLWEGLGYYQRARNLHKAAGVVVEQHGGRLPQDVDGLKSLPGIGPYTAGAIASIAFGQDEAIVDGNVTRVLARLFDIDEVVASGAGARRVWAHARELLPSGRASDFNQALMDLGGSLCTPRAPKCEECPLRADCQAFANGTQLQRPVKGKKTEQPTRHFASAVVLRRGRVLLRQRDEGLLGGLWEFPKLESAKGSRALAALLREWGLDVELEKVGDQIKHSYSHFHARVRVYTSNSVGGRLRRQAGLGLKWVGVTQLGALPMGKIDREIAKRIHSDVG